MALDINPLSFIGDLYSTGKMEKWWRLGVSCGIAAFVGFWGTLGTVGAAVLASTHSPTFALTTAFFAACVVMAASVLLSVRRAGVWKDLSVALPPELDKIVSGTDVMERSRDK